VSCKTIMSKIPVIKDIPLDESLKHPTQPYPDILPKHEFTLGLIAPKGQGKTTCIINWILFYKNYFNRIIIMSPTVKNDPKWAYLMEQDVLVENKNLKRIIKKIAKKKREKCDIAPEADDRIVYNPLEQEIKPHMEPINTSNKFDPKISEDMVLTTFNKDDISKIVKQQNHIVDLLKKHGYTKYDADRILFVLDDMVGSPLFGREANNPFLTLNTNHRHGSFSLLIATQGFNEIPKTIRTQFSCVIILKIFSETEIQTIRDELPMDMHPKRWMDVYDICTADQFSFMYFNSQQVEGKRVFKNFEQLNILPERRLKRGSEGIENVDDKRTKK
jgi:hypothetical protein